MSLQEMPEQFENEAEESADAQENAVLSPATDSDENLIV